MTPKLPLEYLANVTLIDDAEAYVVAVVNPWGDLESIHAKSRKKKRCAKHANNGGVPPSPPKSREQVEEDEADAQNVFHVEREKVESLYDSLFNNGCNPYE